MLQIILLIMGGFALVRLPRLLRARSSDYPDIDPVAFAAWRSTEKAATIWLLIASWGVLILQIGLSVAVGIAMAVAQASDEAVKSATMWLTLAGIALMLIFLVPAAIYGSKSKRLREAAGIQWPKKTAKPATGK